MQQATYRVLLQLLASQQTRIRSASAATLFLFMFDLESSELSRNRKLFEKLWQGFRQKLFVIDRSHFNAFVRHANRKLRFDLLDCRLASFLDSNDLQNLFSSLYRLKRLSKIEREILPRALAGLLARNRKLRPKYSITVKEMMRRKFSRDWVCACISHLNIPSEEQLTYLESCIRSSSSNIQNYALGTLAHLLLSYDRKTVKLMREFLARSTVVQRIFKLQANQKKKNNASRIMIDQGVRYLKKYYPDFVTHKKKEPRKLRSSLGKQISND